MILFVNAKINLGLNIVKRLESGYHLLQSVFYPIGLFNGTAENPEPFCDILEINETGGVENEYMFSGRKIDCNLENNLVWRAAETMRAFKSGLKITLDKHLPDGAGLGGGSADASFTISGINRLIKDITGCTLSQGEMMEIAAGLGADCPFFISNSPAYVEGIGEKMESIPAVLEGWWGLIVKPDVYVSTREAFRGVSPRQPLWNAKETVLTKPVAEWHRYLHNDFEDSIFPKHPELAEIKKRLYACGAEYASMSGSGSSLYGLFESKEMARNARNEFGDYFTALCRL